LILERENDVAMGTTKANSAIVHAGYDPEPGTLMAKLNVQGSEQMEKLCRELDVEYRRCGSMVLAFSTEETATLKTLYDRGIKNGVKELRLLSGEEARTMEPALAETVRGALLAPTAAIVDPWGLCLAAAETAVRNGAELKRGSAVAGVEDLGELTASTAEKAFPVVDDAQGTKMREAIAAAKAEGDSVGGIIEVAAFGLPVGLGDPMFGGIENRIAAIVFGIPAVKGVEFGEGFGAARLRGSENNDGFCVRDGKIGTITNHCGGILGGITNGMPLRFRAAVKPTPSIYRPQQSVNLETMEETTLQIQGRHDPCIVPRAVPVMEAAAAIAIYDALLGYQKERM